MIEDVESDKMALTAKEKDDEEKKNELNFKSISNYKL